jgi:hypothetical protein
MRVCVPAQLLLMMPWSASSMPQVYQDVHMHSEREAAALNAARPTFAAAASAAVIFVATTDAARA